MRNKSWPTIARCGVLSLCLSSAGLMAEASECPLLEDEGSSTNFQLVLPNGQDEITCRSETTMDLPRPSSESEPWRDSLGLIFRGLPSGDLYEASISVTFDTTGWQTMPPDIEEGQPLGQVSSWYLSAVPFPLVAGDRQTYNVRHAFTSAFVIPVEISHELPKDLKGTWVVRMNITMTLRRVKDRCYMYTVVKGGSGAGTYFGDVAVLGNPTGVSDDTLDMWFGTEEGEMFDAFQDALSSPAVQQAMQGMTEEQMAQLEAAYKSMGAASEQADPIREVREMLTLTLQDVKFGETGPSAEGGGSGAAALLQLASKVVLVAQLAGDKSLGVDLGAGSITLPVEKVGLKAPGLGLAGTNVERCAVRDPKLVLTLCNHNEAEAIELEAAGAVCGFLDAELCNERGEKFDVTANFLAGRSIEQCIR